MGAAQEQRVTITELSALSSGQHYNAQTTQNSALTICFNSLLDTLSKQAAEQVQQVQLMVRELKRITLLWEELWLSSLSQVYSECTKRMAILENDLNKLSNEESHSKQTDEVKRTVLTEKYRVIVRPILFVMERLWDATSGKAETANEHAFQERFSNAIQDTIAALKEPLQFSSSITDGWNKFKHLYTVLQQRSQKKSANQFKMTDISPVLAQMKNTVISMPGIEHHRNCSSSSRYETEQNRWIYIRSVDNFVQILPTKTKPKKLAFYGSDGRKYPYLFKGLFICLFKYSFFSCCYIICNKQQKKSTKILFKKLCLFILRFGRLTFRRTDYAIFIDCQFNDVKNTHRHRTNNEISR